MSNKLKKKIVCCLCDRTVPFTEDCQKLFDKDVCPDCAAKIAKMVNKIIDNNVDKIVSED